MRREHLMEPTKELVDELFMDKVRAAREMAPGDKLMLGPILFDKVCRRMADGIRWQFPDADEARVHQILLERLRIARELEARPMRVSHDE
jgi:hypothetical protein